MDSREVIDVGFEVRPDVPDPRPMYRVNVNFAVRGWDVRDAFNNFASQTQAIDFPYEGAIVYGLEIDPDTFIPVEQHG